MAETRSLCIPDLSKPATVLIQKVATALGGCFAPFQVKRMAKAEAEAAIIRAQGAIEVTDLRRRAVARWVNEEARKQENIESIAEEAIKHLNDSAHPEAMEDDWVTNFFDKCRITSDAEMQKLWAKILAGEANSPGKYTKRTVDAIASLDRSDAEQFARLCTFNCVIGEDNLPLVYDFRDTIYMDAGISFGTLTHLDDIGLISFSPISGFSITEESQPMAIFYEEQSLLLEFPIPDKIELPIGQVILTKTGEQLSRICNVEPVAGFVDYLLKRWMAQDIIAASRYTPLPDGQRRRPMVP